MMEHPASSQAPGWFRERLTHDLPASFVVFLVALPLSMGIAIASGAPVTAGLVTGIVGGIVAGLLAGAPLQVSGPAAGLTVIVYQCVQQYGIEELGVVVLLAGGLQVLAGTFRLGQWFRAVSPAVVQGMLAGIGVLIFCSQFHVMVDDKPKQSGIANLLTIPESIQKAISWPLDTDTADERANQTRLLKQTGLLHLQQTEIGEEVHHLLAGLDAEPAASTVPDAEASEDAPDTPAAGAPQTESEIAAGHLRRLVGVQSKVIEQLARSDGIEPSEQLLTARRACREALADLETGNIHTARASQDLAAQAIAELRNSLKSHRWAAGLGVLTIALLIGWQATVGRRWKFLPAPLVAVAVATTAAAVLSLPVLYVEVPDNLLEEIYVPTLAELRSLFSPGLLLAAVQIAVIASAETLLCATAVDQLHQGPRTRYDKELIAQGAGNIICGLLTALPMTGVIVRSSANVQAGAKSRWSSVLHGVWLLLFVVGLSFVLRMIPTASLAAILVYTGYKLVNIKTIKSLLSFGKSEAAIYVGTMVAIVVTDLLTGVLVGVGLSILKLLYRFSSVRASLRVDRENNRATLFLRGSATFLRLPKLARVLEKVPPGSELRIDFDRLVYIDHACLDLLASWAKQHESSGGRVMVDWNVLTSRFTDDATGAPGRQTDSVSSEPPTGDERESREVTRSGGPHETAGSSDTIHSLTRST